ncbi:hypothetical protein TGPRC2_212275 [Toxoplasma gondii TgCatPRC2]|uniref:Uncharacterized protein n=15 Tax=Toxoplasma gondii TaxID=5811 RepID=A0A125YN98_TOXGV|nr:hypothetical protein TGME49_212275 [Toxoplasma gondii ME49]EPR61912.1 hypothetical protein TGGT1_212275 [Toxoplasma gondii GT1]ESS32296.1 hypothetical protein TGVEG_212275 [Toxoplasma gondii VEG]KAF4640378.1 hypothetical protein TGRH88_043040 [Toxoplasma gondii]KFG31213.1 hypothetical protein TGP89_212275 [Toxoplasma gondii p89]KFG33493.1 hypothetical protein TGFOU_212275 [Toxoplasma gondii FOU]KFG45891.1 hypothetical protein TGDOM2_212275 [Toxoplasma gondii GAB2-2007-GAL-DOM2]KFG57306.1 |eukprot:XP_018635886.1 hypothetical protein TGME49_212275 [Toxoplasma gondii ME49]
MKLTHFREAFDLAALVFTMRKDAARRCAAGEENDCQSMQNLEMLGLAEPNPMPQIGSFHLSSSCFEVGDGEGDRLGIRGRYKRISRPYGSPLTRVTPTKQGDLASMHRLPVFTETGMHNKAFAAAGAKARIFDLIKNLFGSGSDITDADNFEGGNQGSYFDFMYPLSTDYPWACVCDEGQYVQWEANEIQAVPCRNQVDMSAQGITAACNPSLHKMNHAAMTTKGWQSAVCSVISISVGFWFV